MTDVGMNVSPTSQFPETFKWPIQGSEEVTYMTAHMEQSNGLNLPCKHSSILQLRCSPYLFTPIRYDSGYRRLFLLAFHLISSPVGLHYDLCHVSFRDGCTSNWMRWLTIHTNH